MTVYSFFNSSSDDGALGSELAYQYVVMEICLRKGRRQDSGSCVRREGSLTFPRTRGPMFAVSELPRGKVEMADVGGVCLSDEAGEIEVRWWRRASVYVCQCDIPMPTRK